MSDYFDRIERQLVDRVQSAPHRPPWPALAVSRLVPVAAVLVVIAVVAVFAGLTGRSGTRVSGSGDRSGLAFSAVTADGRPPTTASVKDAVAILRRRFRAQLPGVHVGRTGDRVTLSGVTRSTRTRALALTAPGVLRFYDWEADALAPDGRSVASGVSRQDPAALEISQGRGTSPGQVGNGSLSLYQAVRLADHAARSLGASPIGVALYLFGRPGSAACATIARDHGQSPIAGAHCLLAGPASSTVELRAQLPAGVRSSQGQRLAVPRGLVLIQAAGADPGSALGPVDVNGRFFLLFDRPAPIANRQLTAVAPSTDAAGQPDVTFSLTPAANRAFTAVTRAVARRGTTVSTAGHTFDQHFAIALDGRLLTVPSIDYRVYPEGIQGGDGADIAGGFTARQARDLAVLLRDGPLPVRLLTR